MIDVVYTLGSGSTWDNNELRYSLRSIEKHLKNFRNIYIVGEWPDFLQNVFHIEAEDKFHPSRNIMEKLMIACRQEDISEDFIFFNDDFFLLKDIDTSDYPYYHDGYISKLLDPDSTKWYQGYIKETHSALLRSQLQTLHFDIHTPIVYNKQLFRDIMPLFDWNEKLMVKSIYCNTLKIAGRKISDCKIKRWKYKDEIEQIIKGRHVFSTGDHCLRDIDSSRRSPMKTMLENLYPNKSKYER